MFMPTCFRDRVTLAYKPRIELGKVLLFFFSSFFFGLIKLVGPVHNYIHVLEMTRSTQNFYFLKFCYHFDLLIKSM